MIGPELGAAGSSDRSGLIGRHWSYVPDLVDHRGGWFQLYGHDCDRLSQVCSIAGDLFTEFGRLLGSHIPVPDEYADGAWFGLLHRQLHGTPAWSEGMVGFARHGSDFKPLLDPLKPPRDGLWFIVGNPDLLMASAEVLRRLLESNPAPEPPRTVIGKVTPQLQMARDLVMSLRLPHRRDGSWITRVLNRAARLQLHLALKTIKGHTDGLAQEQGRAWPDLRKALDRAVKATGILGDQLADQRLGVRGPWSITHQPDRPHAAESAIEEWDAALHELNLAIRGCIEKEALTPTSAGTERVIHPVRRLEQQPKAADALAAR